MTDAGTCTVTDNTDGSKTVSCPDGTSVTIPPGGGCTVADAGASCKQIVCDDGTTEVVCAPPASSQNFAATHDPNDPSYNSACLSCHADKLTEVTLSATPAFHPRKMGATAGGAPIIPGATPSEKCVFCHKAVDMSPNRAAGNLRRNVDVAICTGCHTSGGFDFYLP